MPHNTTGTNTFTNPIPTYSDGDPVAQALNDPTVQALANRDTNLTTRLAVLEALSISSRLTALESFQSTITGQNLNSRVTALENLSTRFKAWAVVNFVNGSPSLGEHVFINAVSIDSGALKVSAPSQYSSGVYGVFVQQQFDWSINPSTFNPYILGVNYFLITGIYLGAGASYSPSGINFGDAGTDGSLVVGVVAT